MCISVTDAWNYDIKNDFHCSKLMLLNEKKVHTKRMSELTEDKNFFFSYFFFHLYSA